MKKRKSDTEVRQPKDNEKSEDIPKEERITLAACKDNKDIVSREDLKSIFQKFGTIKVFIYLHSL